MEVRLLIAFLLMGAVMFVTPYFFKSQVPPPGKKDAAVQTASQKTDAAVPTGAGRQARAGCHGAGGTRRRGGRYRALACRRDAAEGRAPIRHRNRPVQGRLQQSGRDGAQLAAQEDQGQRRQDAGTGQHRCRPGFPLFALLPEARSPPSTSTGPGTSRPSIPDGLGVTYEFSDGHVGVRKVVPLRERQLSLDGLHGGHAGRQAAART